MNSLLKISEAAKLALHTVVLLCEKDDGFISIKDIVAKIPFSEAHLSKVLQRLGKEGFVKSIRGPNGGFALNKDPKEIRLLDIYEAIDGPVDLSDCLLDRKICGRDKCILDGVLDDLNTNFYRILKETSISDVAEPKN
jgi:Rrf2 family transcriptional regulator, nitric oxide-sensitive transcriptional repressor